MARYKLMVDGQYIQSYTHPNELSHIGKRMLMEQIANQLLISPAGMELIKIKG